jgi:lipoprotein-anchoring transpeptidase ErfK/SrfK
MLRTAPRYARPGVPEPGSVPSSWWDRPSELPVIAAQPGWVEVRVAQRPNGTTAWLPASDVKLGTTPYRIVIDLATTHLMLYENGRMILSAPAGVGAGNDPTPVGEFFVAFREQAPSAGYGPFILVTSAHSPNISDWDGSGDAIIGIHGPLGDDSEIGTTGAQISHGCIRLHLQDLAVLAGIPPGTPIDVTG